MSDVSLVAASVDTSGAIGGFSIEGQAFSFQLIYSIHQFQFDYLLNGKSHPIMLSFENLLNRLLKGTSCWMH